MKLTKNFNKSEFDSKDGSPMPDDVLDNIKDLARELQLLRCELDASIKINSGYRSEAHNRAIGGVSSSRHVKGLAADIVVEGFTPDEVATAVEKLMEGGFIKMGGVGRYNTFTHVDIRGYKARWDNRK
jgi:uncharacterized protein YcbK (DUF882 family)